jgi:NADPH-dependent glutamate synthase beta subunit-like oxidoreductase
LPVACGLICEHPCEITCRRGMVDDPLNIRGLKLYATTHMEDYDPPKALATGKRVAIIGGGPAGLSAAYYLALMGHVPTIFEQRSHLGGMMRYGIPSYRLPRERLEEEIAWILKQGVKVEYGISVGTDIPIDDVRRDYNAVYVAIGAHADRKVGLPGEDAQGVISAVQMLREIGDGDIPDFRGQSVVVIGGGNVAMDVSRSAVRAGADKVVVVYRRRIDDMTAQDEEIAGAIAEGCEILDLHAPIGIETEDGTVCGLRVQPQIIGPVVGGRPKPRDAARESFVIPCDKVLVAVGQTIDSAPFSDYGLPTKRGAMSAKTDGEIEGFDGFFSGGDCVSGPSTVIRAIAAGKVAACNIDKRLGFDHEIVLDVEIPAVRFRGKLSCARSNMTERDAIVRRKDFELMEHELTDEEALQEASRCLRCDHFGFGAFCGGRVSKW